MEIAVPAALFAAVGTAGQRCTTTRRLVNNYYKVRSWRLLNDYQFLHEKIYDEYIKKLLHAYQQVPIGDPLSKKTLCGPLHTKQAVQQYKDTIAAVKKAGGEILYGGKVLDIDGGNFVQPTVTLVSEGKGLELTQHEVFVPILHVIKFSVCPYSCRVNLY